MEQKITKIQSKKKNFKVLIIDDEIEILDMVSELAQSLGYDVITANTAEKAFDLIPYCDGILSDVNMPDKERLNEILKEAYVNVPVIRFSAANQIGLVNFMLSKPFSLAKLKGAFEQLELFSGLNQKDVA